MDEILHLNEMTLKLDHFPNVSDTIEHLQNNAEYIGDIDNLYVFKSSFKETILYFLSETRKPKVLAFLQTRKDGNNTILLIAYTIPEHRNKSLIKRLLFFVKGKLGYSIIDYGALTQDGIKLYDELDKSNLFVLKWINIKTGKAVEYKDKKDKISDIKQTDWRVLIEKDLNTFELFDRILPNDSDGNSWPVFFKENCV